MGGTDHYEKAAIPREAERNGFLERVEIVCTDRITLFDNMILFSVLPIQFDPIAIALFLSTPVLAKWKATQSLPWESYNAESIHSYKIVFLMSRPLSSNTNFIPGICVTRSFLSCF